MLTGVVVVQPSLILCELALHSDGAGAFLQDLYDCCPDMHGYAYILHFLVCSAVFLGLAGQH